MRIREHKEFLLFFLEKKEWCLVQLQEEGTASCDNINYKTMLIINKNSNLSNSFKDKKLSNNSSGSSGGFWWFWFGNGRNSCSNLILYLHCTANTNFCEGTKSIYGNGISPYFPRLLIRIGDKFQKTNISVLRIDFLDRRFIDLFRQNKRTIALSDSGLFKILNL